MLSCFKTACTAEMTEVKVKATLIQCQGPGQGQTFWRPSQHQYILQTLSKCHESLQRTVIERKMKLEQVSSN